jgi:hypothetical protein
MSQNNCDPTTQGNPSPDPADFFGFNSGNDSTGLSGTDHGSTDAYGAYDDPFGGAGLGVSGSDVTSTGANGSEPHAAPRDGGDVTVTNGGWSGIADGRRTGSTNTNAESLTGLGPNVTDTGIGHGSAGSSHTSPADQTSPWKNADGS